MDEWGGITVGDLVRWCEEEQRASQGSFPELFRRLLWATPDITEISIPTGDGVAQPGVDGRAVVKFSSSLLPAGKYVCELGTSKDMGRKANADYAKRRADASEDVGFVFATPRPWPGKHEWAEQRRAEGHFRTVIALDGHDIEAWLSDAHNVELWLADIMGRRRDGAESLGRWWERFSRSTNPVLPAPLFLAGRDSAAEKLTAFLSGEPNVLHLRVTWSSDALAFIHAVLSTSEDEALRNMSATAVSSSVGWDHAVLCSRGLLVTTFDNPDPGEASVHVVVVHDAGSAHFPQEEMRLSSVDSDKAARVFDAAGVPWHRAHQLGEAASGNLRALMRSISVTGQRLPAWAAEPRASDVAALMLAGRWSGSAQDSAAVGELAGQPWHSLSPLLLRVSDGADPVFRNHHDVTTLITPDDAFQHLWERVDRALAARFGALAQRALLAPDPLGQRPAPDAMAACAQCEGRAFSPELRRGLATSLVAARVIAQDQGSGSLHATAGAVIGHILGRLARAESSLMWSDVVDLLPYLAEACPDQFLDVLDDDLDRDHPGAAQLFSVGAGLAQQRYLLGALQILCWSPDHLIRCVQFLARLCRLEMPDRDDDTPMATLAKVLCGWVRYTDADTATKLEGVDACRRESADLGWELLKRLWPTSNAITMPPQRPRFRRWGEHDEAVAIRDWADFLDGLVARAVAWVEDAPQQLTWFPEAMERMQRVYPAAVPRLVEAVERAVGVGIPTHVGLALRDNLRWIVATHPQRCTTFQPMDPALLARLTSVADALEPVDDPRCHAHLFSWEAERIGRRGDDPAARECQRREGLTRVLQLPDWPGHLADLAERVPDPPLLGNAVASLADYTTEDTMLAWLTSPTPALGSVADAWCDRRLIDGGPAVLQHLLDNTEGQREARRRLVQRIPAQRQFWAVLANHPDAQDLYWDEATSFNPPDKDALEAMETLMARGRAWAALGLVMVTVGWRGDDVPRHLLPSAELVMSILDAAHREHPERVARGEVDGHALGELLGFLEREGVPLEERARVELEWCRVLSDGQWHALREQLSTQPEKFVELVCLVTRPDGESVDTSTEWDTRMERAMWVLMHMPGFPGRRADGTLDPDVLTQWVDGARALFAARQRQQVGDEFVGKALAPTPLDDDGTWPSVAVKDLLQHLASRDVEQGLKWGRLFPPGIAVEWAGSAAARKHEEAARSREWAKAAQSRWPRVARVLKHIASGLEEGS